MGKREDDRLMAIGYAYAVLTTRDNGHAETWVLLAQLYDRARGDGKVHGQEG